MSVPLKWHGGKKYLASTIVNMIPKHIHYVEPFFGSGAVLFAKPTEMMYDHSEVINDLHKELTTFYVVLRNENTFQEFQLRLQLTPFSELEWDSSSSRTTDFVGRAVRFFIRYRQSRQGIGKCFATLSRNRIRGGMNEQVSAWLSAVESLQDAHLRLRRVVILNQHANDVILSQDGENTFFYLDPPYVPETRTAKKVYEHEMTYEEHEKMLQIVSHCQGRFILSGYRCALYDWYAQKYGWSREDVPMPNSASGSAVKEVRVESLWYNF